MVFDFRRRLVRRGGELDERAANEYTAELCRRFAESPEGEALAEHGGQPGGHLGIFLHYAMEYIGTSPAQMDASDIRETLDLMAEKVSAEPEDLDTAIPELEAFCDFAGRAFECEQAAEWKQAIRGHAKTFHRAVRDPKQWGMAKSLFMATMASGRDLSSPRGNDWLRTLQAKQLVRIVADKSKAPAEHVSLADRLRRALDFVLRRGAPSTEDADVRPFTSRNDAGGADAPPHENPSSISGRWPRADRLAADLETDLPTLPKGQKQKEKARRRQAKASRRRHK